MTENLVNVLGGQFAFKSIHKIGSIFEVSIPINNSDYVSPCFDEDISNKRGGISNFFYTTINPGGSDTPNRKRFSVTSKQFNGMEGSTRNEFSLNESNL